MMRVMTVGLMRRTSHTWLAARVGCQDGGGGWWLIASARTAYLSCDMGA